MRKRTRTLLTTGLATDEGLQEPYEHVKLNDIVQFNVPFSSIEIDTLN